VTRSAAPVQIPPVRVIPWTATFGDPAVMTAASDLLTSLSGGLADAVTSVAPSVVQVQSRRRPASGVVYAPETILTTAAALGREDGVRVRQSDGAILEADFLGWDPSTRIVVLRAPGLTAPAASQSTVPSRVGHLALAVARSWSNAVTASAGIIAVIGGPLATGRRRSIEQVIRTTAPMHDGFTGGAFVDTGGGVIGITTALAIRGTAVVIPASIAWKTAASIVEHGHVKRGFLGVAGQAVRLPERQQSDGRDAALLIAGLTRGGPADAAGVLVGDLLLQVEDRQVESPEDLLDLLSDSPPGRVVTLHLLRGGSPLTIPVGVGERPMQ